MSEKQMRQLIMLGLAGAAVYYFFIRAKPFVPQMVTVTPENPGLLPPPAHAQTVTTQPGWLTGNNSWGS